MAISLTSKKDVGSADRYELTGQLKFDTAADALAAITEKLGQSQHLSLNLAGVTAANSAGLALLIECKAMALRSGKTVSFENIPDALQKIAEVCQVQDLLA